MITNYKKLNDEIVNLDMPRMDLLELLSGCAYMKNKFETDIDTAGSDYESTYAEQMANRWDKLYKMMKSHLDRFDKAHNL